MMAFGMLLGTVMNETPVRPQCVDSVTEPPSENGLIKRNSHHLDTSGTLA